MFRRIGVLPGLVAFASIGVQAALLPDGGFEAIPGPGLGSWQGFGDVSVQSGSVGVNPPEGSHHALLSTLGGAGETPYSGTSAVETFLPSFWLDEDDPPAPSSALHDFLGVSVYDAVTRTLLPWVYGVPDGDGSGSVIGEGSALRRSFFGEQGQTLSIDYNYVTVDGGLDPAIFTLVAADFGFQFGQSLSMDLLGASLLDLCTRIDGGSACDGGSYFVEESGYRTLEFLLPHTGEYTLGFAVYERGDGRGASALLIDNVRLSAIPLPASGWLLLAGAGWLGWWGRKKRLNAGPIHA